MRIQRDSQVCGYPAVQMRDLMRRWKSEANGVTLIQDTLGIALNQAEALLKAMLAAGLVEAESGLPDGCDGQIYRTVSGSALAMASAAPPIHREVARQRLHELIGRMQTVNDEARFLVGVEEASVFGSYLTASDRLGDLDLSYKTFRKIDDPEAFAEANGRAAEASGRHFQTLVDYLFWSHTEVRLFLKNRSRVYSLSQDEPLLKDATIDRLAIFRGRKPFLNWKSL